LNLCRTWPVSNIIEGLLVDGKYNEEFEVTGTVLNSKIRLLISQTISIFCFETIEI